MKKERSISTQLGITIEDAAMLLGVSRGQLAMYEVGKRSLPFDALQLLGKIELHKISTDFDAVKKLDVDKSNLDVKLLLEKMLKENNFQIIIVNRKLEALRKKQESQLNLKAFVEYTKLQNANKKETGVGNAHFISAKVLKSCEDDCSCELLKLEIKLEVLEFEERLLRRAVIATSVIARHEAISLRY